MLGWVEASHGLLQDLNKSLETVRRKSRLGNQLRSVRLFVTRNYKLSFDLVKDLGARMKSMERCLRDEEKHESRKKKPEAPSSSSSSSFSVMSTLPLVIFLVSVSVVPVLILGLYLLTHKCKAQV